MSPDFVSSVRKSEVDFSSSQNLNYAGRTRTSPVFPSCCREIESECTAAKAIDREAEKLGRIPCFSNWRGRYSAVQPST